MRWFAKWFGRRKDEDDEPARFTTPPNVRTATKTPRPKASASVRTPAQKAMGFDPYNSGAFERHNAWERTNLR